MTLWNKNFIQEMYLYTPMLKYIQNAQILNQCWESIKFTFGLSHLGSGSGLKILNKNGL